MFPLLLVSKPFKGLQVTQKKKNQQMKCFSNLSTFFPPTAVPDPPENLRWRDKSASGIFLSWEPPKYDGGSTIRGYNVDRCQRGTDKWEPCGEMTPELKCEVTGLTEGQWYSYRVRALNRLGAGLPCKATDEIQAVDPKGTKATFHRLIKW